MSGRWKYALALVAAPVLIAVAAHGAGKSSVPVTPLANLKAFLLLIQYAEGTYGANAYRTLFGGGLFSDYAAHPHTAVTRSGVTSTAAGAYQILYSTWEGLQSTLHLPDFSPASQDRAAIELIRRRGALADVLTGSLTTAIYKCRKEWASLPGAGYGQQERQLSTLTAFFKAAGGTPIR